MQLHSAVVAERLRRLTRNQIPSGSVGSNPTDCEKVFLINCERMVMELHLVDTCIRSYKRCNRKIFYILVLQAFFLFQHLENFSSHFNLAFPSKQCNCQNKLVISTLSNNSLLLLFKMKHQKTMPRPGIEPGTFRSSV